MYQLFLGPWTVHLGAWEKAGVPSRAVGLWPGDLYPNMYSHPLAALCQSKRESGLGP